MDMGRSHWNNGASGTILISISTMVLIVRDKILSLDSYNDFVRMWSHTLNIVRLLVIN